jgi:hypothetical protein
MKLRQNRAFLDQPFDVTDVWQRDSQCEPSESSQKVMTRPASRTLSVGVFIFGRAGTAAAFAPFLI